MNLSTSQLLSPQSGEAALRPINIMSDFIRMFLRAIRRDGIIVTFEMIAKRIAWPVVRLLPRFRAIDALNKELEQRDAEFDKLYGVDTKGRIPQVKLKLNSNNPNKLYASRYQASDPIYFKNAIEALPIDYNNFVFKDFGSGKGRAILMASEFPFKRVAGVEFSEELHRIAQDNILRFHSESVKCKDVQSVCMDAVAYPLPDDSLVCYFYDPFDEIIMAKVLLNIQKSFLQNPREIFIVYYDPRPGCRIFDKADWLKRVWVSENGLRVCIWRTMPESLPHRGMTEQTGQEVDKFTS
jgi:hypothetical protein